MKVQDLMRKALILWSCLAVGILLVFLAVQLMADGGFSSETFVSGNTSTVAQAEDRLGVPAQEPEDGQYPFIVWLAEQADLSQAETMSDWETRGRYVLNQLRGVAQNSQPSVLQALKKLEQQGHVTAFHPHYVRNLIVVEGDAAAVATMEALPQVATTLRLDPPRQASTEADPTETQPSADTESPAGINWNIIRIGADQVWSQFGVTGTGIIVANLDSGVDYLHPALNRQYRGNLGGTYDHEYNWWDPSDECDSPCNHESSVPHLSNGHGTKSMGIMVGDDGAGHQIGVAPGATWIAAFACCEEINMVENMISAFEWMVAPWQVNDFDPNHPTADPSKRPHVVNGSLGLTPGDTILLPIMEAYQASCIFPAFAAGTIPGGAPCGSVATPADTSIGFGTGAVDEYDNIMAISGRGPVAYEGWLNTSWGTGPDIVAPGDNYTSSIPGGGYAYFGSTSGATPHSAGAVALLWSAEPALIGRLQETAEILRRSALPLYTTEQCGGDTPDDVPNNTYGWGRLDVLAAVESIWQAGTLSGQVTSSGSGDPVGGATVSANRGGLTLTAETGANGNYELLLGQGTYTVTVTAYGHESIQQSGVIVSQDMTTTLDVPLFARPVYNLSGSVVGSLLASGDPLQAQLGVWGTPFSTTITLSGGIFSATLSEGSYWLRVIAPGYTAYDQVISLTQNLELDIVLAPTWTYYFRDSNSFCGPSYSWIDTTGGVAHNQPYLSFFPVSLQNLPFTFYGDTHTVLYVDTNGHVTFGNGYRIPNKAIPFEGPPNNAISGFGEWLNPLYGSQGVIYHDILEQRYFVAEFDQFEHVWSGSPESFEFVLDSETGAILLQYDEVSLPDFATVGVENQDGTDGVVYSYGGSRPITDDLAVGFYPILGPPPVDQVASGIFGTLSGRVTISETGQPVVGAIVTATTFLRTLTTTTDVNGQYVFADICADLYILQAHAPGFEPSPTFLARMRWPDDVLVVDLTLEWSVGPVFLPVVTVP